MLAFFGMSGLVRVNLPSSENAGITRIAISKMKNAVDMILERDIILLLSSDNKRTENPLY